MTSRVAHKRCCRARRASAPDPALTHGQVPPGVETEAFEMGARRSISLAPTGTVSGSPHLHPGTASMPISPRVGSRDSGLEDNGGQTHTRLVQPRDLSVGDLSPCWVTPAQGTEKVFFSPPGARKAVCAMLLYNLPRISHT